MKRRPKRLLLGCSLLVLAGIGLLAALEWSRRRQVAAAGGSPLDGSGTLVTAKDLENHYRDAEAFARLCADLKEHCDALKQRFLRLKHTRKTRQTRFDTKGKPIAIVEAIYHVHYSAGTEHKQEIQRRQLLGEPSLFDPDKAKIEQEDTQIAGPFSKDTPDGLYRYHLAAVEELQGRHLLRIHFEPVTPVERSFTGSAWIDPDSHQPVRMQGSLAKKRFGVDHFDMLLDYGLSENGHNQLRHVIMDMAGGFALVSLHYRIESELGDYRESNKKD
jgi:hypothetical protein